MSKPTKLTYAALLAVTAIFLAVTLSIPDHGNGNGWEYGLWTAFFLYPLYYAVLGIGLGLLLPARWICVSFPILYGITFAAFFINYLTDGQQMPEILPFALSCTLYPLICTAAAAIVRGIKTLIISTREFTHRENKS